MFERVTATGARRHLPRVAILVIVFLLIAVPFYVEAFWLQMGLFVFAAAIGAIGLNLLTGSTGQLSLAHAFFLAVGAYGYAYFSGSKTQIGGGVEVGGLELPALLAAVLAVALAGFAGLLFSPIASRLRGIYLGVASLSLVFIGQHILLNAQSVTGGFYGRNTAPFSLFGFSFTNEHPPLTVLNIDFGQRERLWYLGLGLLILCYLFAINLLRGRPGRALQTIRDSEIAAATMGVNVRAYKAAAFVMSSMYAGLAGVLVALAFQRPVPDYFSLSLSITYLAMIVIGGLGSVRGAVVGAAFVTALPQILTHYSSSLTFLAQPGESGVGAAEFANYSYGAAIVLVILVAPGGLAGVLSGRSGRAARARASVSGEPPGSTVTGPASPEGDSRQQHGPTGATSSVTRNKEAEHQ
ncbi:MAG: branched-chain amino acid ABC transporter permease [Jatrophihabitans sp.]|uniref:branched-chain amino acid ABC transporter permease n=1 Tax=Jatrophihabitans sp. TaxID=1932789 RepID=UPI0039110CCD